MGASLTREEEDFLNLLEAELEKFNSFFVEKEEEYIIRQKELEDRVAMAAKLDSKDDLMMVRREIVDFHGEMVLLENYSALNYTGYGTKMFELGLGVECSHQLKGGKDRLCKW